MKTCTACQQQKRETEFNQRVLADDGLQPWCRECQRVSRSKYRAEHREKEIAYARQYRKDHPPDEAEKEQKSIKWAKWYAENREHRSDYNKRYVEENREYIQARGRARYQKDPHLRARRLIQSRVYRGAMPPASSLLCADCGSQAQDYDHYLGYEGWQADAVHAVCKSCHIRRTASRVPRKQID